MSKGYNISQFSKEIIQIIPHLMRLSQSMVKSDSDDLLSGKITLPQFLVLELLKSKDSVKMNDIAKTLKVSLPAATGTVKRLVSLKMVKRHHDASDRRVIHVVLTKKGENTIERVRTARRKVIEKAFGHLSDKERQTYLNILRKVKKGLDEKANKK